MRREDREADARLGQDLERLQIDRGFRQPHPLGGAAEASFEVARAPADLATLVPPVPERRDHVVVHLGQGRAVPVE